MKTRRHIYNGLWMAAAALLCLAGCKKDEEGEKVMLGTQFEKAVSVQKTCLGEGNTVCWSAGDKVNVNGTEYTVAADGSVAVAENDNYYAVYPYEGSSADINGGTVTVPASQTYTLENGRQVLNAPMAARLDTESGILHFKNLFSLLKVTVCADEQPFTITYITVTATGSGAKPLAGTFGFSFNGATTADPSTAPTVEEITSGGSNTVFLRYINTEMEVGKDMDFYIAVHPIEEQNLTVYVHGLLGTGKKPVVYTHTTAVTHSLSRSRIGGLAINLQQLQPDHDFVDLGLSVLWAVCNIGTDYPNAYGDFFAWGETEPNYLSLSPVTWKDGKTGYNWESYPFHNGTSETGDKPYDASTGVLLPEHDAAHVNWGGSWRMPTEAECRDLMTNCKWEWTEKGSVKGYKVFRENNPIYQDTLFFIAPGYTEGTTFKLLLEGMHGNYWSSSLTSSDNANKSQAVSLDFLKPGTGDFEQKIDDRDFRYISHSIRPVQTKQ